MKRITLLFAILMGFTFGTSASPFKLNHVKLEADFERCEDITSQINLNLVGNLDFFKSIPEAESDKSQITAAIIAFLTIFVVSPTVSFIYGFVGGITGGIGYLVCLPILFIPFLPYHRWYLGTSGNGLKIGALYCLTLNWCGILPLVDGIILLSDDSKTKFIDNGKYVMWKE